MFTLPGDMEAIMMEKRSESNYVGDSLGKQINTDFWEEQAYRIIELVNLKYSLSVKIET